VANAQYDVVRETNSGNDRLSRGGPPEPDIGIISVRVPLVEAECNNNYSAYFVNKK
jgi:hypothetical protein